MRIDDSSIFVDRNTCIACGICVDRCIMDNLRLSVAPCRQVCPINMNCQGYIRLIALGQEEKALEQLQEFGPFVPLIADTCHAPCETACARKKKDGAVHILALKKYLAKKYDADFYTIGQIQENSGRTIALAGVDIFSLATGFRALQSGHAIAIFAEEPDMSSFDTRIQPIVNALKNAGALIFHGVDLKDIQHPVGVNPFDAVVVSRTSDKSVIHLEVRSCDQPSGMTEAFEPVFSGNSNTTAKKNPVFEIADAFETAESLNRFLTGKPLDWGRGFYTQKGAVKAYTTDERVGNDEPRLDLGKESNGLDASTAQTQASRCYGCGRAFEKNQTCWYCLPCELECPQAALEVKIPYLIR